MRIFSKKAFKTLSKGEFDNSRCITEADSYIDYHYDFLNQSNLKLSPRLLESFNEKKDDDKLKQKIEVLEQKVEDLIKIVEQERQSNSLISSHIKKLQESISHLEKKLVQAEAENQNLRQEYDKFLDQENTLFNQMILIRKESEDKTDSLTKLIQMHEKTLDDSRMQIFEYRNDKEKSKKTILDLTLQSSNKSKIIDELKISVPSKEEILYIKKLTDLDDQIKSYKDKKLNSNEEMSLLKKQIIEKDKIIANLQLNVKENNKSFSDDKKSLKKHHYG